MTDPQDRPDEISVPWTRVEPKPEPPPSPPRAPAIAPAHRAIAWLALVLVVVLMLVASSPYWAPSLASALPWGHAAEDKSADAVAALQARLGDADSALKTLADRVARLERGATAMTGLNDRMAKLESGGAAVTNLNERVAKLEARPEPAPPGPAAVPAPAAPAANPDADAAVQALKDQVAKLADDTAAATARAAKLELQIASAGDQGRGDRALLLALANLRIAMSGSAPYAAELSTVQAVAGDRADVKEMLSALSEGAASGMPNVPSLATRFDRDVAPAILRAATRTESEDWGDQILSRLKRLVVVRRIRPGAAGGDSTQDAVARAEAALRAGDLTGAIAALGNLTGPAATAAAPWLASAKQRLAAESAVTKLWQAEAARIAAASSAGSKP